MKGVYEKIVQLKLRLQWQTWPVSQETYQPGSLTRLVTNPSTHDGKGDDNKMRHSDRELKLRLVVIDPPSGVVFALRRGKQDLVSPTMATGADLSFDLTVRVRREGEEPPNLLGDFVQGPRGQCYLGLTSGTQAGQMDSCWTRGAKIPL